IDGRDIWPLIEGRPGGHSPQEAYHFYWGDELQAVRMGRWKLHFPHRYRTLGNRKAGTGGKPEPYEQADVALTLFDIENDAGETIDVKGKHPDVVAAIEKLADRMREDLGDSARKMAGSGRRPVGRVQKGDEHFVLKDGKQTLAEAQ
ncbi:MAG: hypothetical protein GX616_13365, partial [Planctomycetes bacterium]|nr:hypothetical protein [Planctomycetota bacterium]